MGISSSSSSALNNKGKKDTYNRDGHFSKLLCDDLFWCYEKPEYEPKVKAKQPWIIKEGEKFELKDRLVCDDDDDEGDYLVRKDGTTQIKVENLKNKYVLLCCFYVPLYWADDAILYARSISSLCAELATLKAEECEMVIVAKMRPRWEDNKGAFDHFFKAFPETCLTVPFHHKKRTDRICWSLGLRSFYPEALCIDPYDIVLQNNLECFWKHGVKTGFPFSSKHLKSVDKRYNRLLRSKVGFNRPLATLLGLELEPSDHLLKDVTGNNQISISELEKKNVGLYLCCKGNLLDKLCEVYHLCKNKEPYGFEIVVVWFPDITGIEESKFKELMTAEIKLRECCSFWVLPFDNSVTRRLVHLCAADTIKSDVSDRLLVVGAGGGFVDPIADVIMELWEGDYAYPFSLDILVDREVERLRGVKLESIILEHIKSVVLVKDKEQIPLSPNNLNNNLKGKQVYLFHSTNSWYTAYGQWMWYLLIKEHVPDCAVLYVQPYEIEYGSEELEGLSMYMCPFDDSLTKYLDTITTVAKHPDNTLAFGEDGRIASLAPAHSFDHCHVDPPVPAYERGYPFAKTLRQDVYSQVVFLIDDHMEAERRERLELVVSLFERRYPF